MSPIDKRDWIRYLLILLLMAVVYSVSACVEWGMRITQNMENQYKKHKWLRTIAVTVVIGLEFCVFAVIAAFTILR